ncbi:hypothetical protein LINPERPRIM_LOCUS14862 [Linum perenne]
MIMGGSNQNRAQSFWLEINSKVKKGGEGMKKKKEEA